MLLTPLIGSILGDRPHLAVACDARGRPSLVGFLHALGRLVVAGVPVRLGPLTHGSAERLLDLENLPEGDGSPPPAPSTWMVNGSRARPLAAPEPQRLGQAGAAGRPVDTTHRSSRSSGQRRHAERSQPRPYQEWQAAHRHAFMPACRSDPGGSADHSSAAPERVLAAFQETMQKFLDVQRTTMLAYLSGRQPSRTRRILPACQSA